MLFLFEHRSSLQYICRLLSCRICLWIYCDIKLIKCSLKFSKSRRHLMVTDMIRYKKSSLFPSNVCALHKKLSQNEVIKIYEKKSTHVPRVSEWVSARGLMLRMKNLFTACKKWRSWRQLKEEENWKSTQLPLKESRELVSCIYVYIRSSWWRLGSTFFRYLCARETTSTIRDCELELKMFIIAIALRSSQISFKTSEKHICMHSFSFTQTHNVWCS